MLFSVYQVQYSYFNETLPNQRWLETEIPLGKYTNKEAFDFAIDRIAVGHFVSSFMTFYFLLSYRFSL